jgi:predicted acylesterase/phospholipase RssA
MIPTLTAVALTALLTAPPDAPDRGGEGPAAISLTVSGGVSLGAYEAGFLAYALGAVRQEESAELKLVTGASAGSLNALLAVLVACGGEVPSSPSDSLFWNTWIPIGFAQLSAAPPGALGAFSRKWLERQATHVEQAWSRGIDASCDVVVGVSTTRVEPRVLRAASGHLELPRMEERFAIRVQGRGPGRPPLATNYVGAGGPLPSPLLVTNADGEIAFSELRNLLFASMAFPVAFAPQPLRTCLAGQTVVPGVCLASEAETATHVDGGIFDNAPIRMAVSLARAGLEPSPDAPGHLAWRRAPDSSAPNDLRRIVFGFVDPDATEYPSAPRRKSRDEQPSLARELKAISGALVDTARSKELATLMEEHPEIPDRIVLPRRHFPAASAPMFAFLGFFEMEFRAFDFYLGMYDAQRMLSEGARARNGARLVSPSSATPQLAAAPAGRFACMRAVYDGAPEAEAACRGEDLADFRALLQLSLDQLYDACRAPEERVSRTSWSNPHCDRAAAGEAPPLVPGVTPASALEWRQRRDEQDVEYSIRLLAAYGFRFRDLGVPPGRGDLAVARIRMAVGRAGVRLAAAQPAANRGPVGFAAKLAADAVAYAAPERTLHLTMGPAESEVGYSRGFPDSSWMPPGLRLALAVGFRGVEGALTTNDAAPFGTILAAGIEVQPPGNSSMAQLRLGLRGGWLFAADDDVGASRCEDDGRGVSACTRPVAQAVIGLTILERFRMQLVTEWFPGSSTRKTSWSVAPGIGLELGF